MNTPVAGVGAETERAIDLVRTGPSRYTARNARGTSLTIGDGSSDDFTPVELLLVALAGCTSITVDPLVSRRAEATSFKVHARADKVRDPDLGSVLKDILLTFNVDYGGSEEALTALADGLKAAEDRLCTVSRTVAVGTQTEWEINTSS